MHHVHHECGGWPSWFSHVGLRILLSMVLLGISWIVFYQKMATTHGMWSSPTGLVALEVASAFIASVGHAVLLTYVMHCVRGSRCGALVAEGVKRRTRSATSVGFDRLMPEATHMHPTSSPSCMELQQRRTAGEVDGSDRIAHAPADEAPSISGGEYRDDVRPPTAHTLLHVKLWLVVLLVELAVTVGIAHLLNSNEHRLSQEITMALIHAGVDAIFVMVALAVMVSVHTIDTRGCSCCCRVVVVMVVVVGVLAAMVWLHLSHMHVGKQLRRGVTGALYDPCQAVGQQLSAKANTSIIMPALLSQGVCDFITGGRSCPRSSHRRPIGVVLEEEHVLLLPLHCPDGSLPSVHVERPDRNELHGGHRLTQPEYRWSSEAYQVEMAQRYHPAYGNYIFTYVGKTTRIASVQMHPRMFRRVVRVPRSSAEKKFRRSWPGVPNGALEVALGASSTYFISCGAEEELLLYPRRDGVWNPRPHMMLKEAPSMGMLPLPEEEDGLRCNLSHSRPPSNVLMLVIDSVSKQAFRRSLPKTTKWIESFNKKMKESAKKDQKRHDAAGEKHVPVHEVFESLGHVVHDHSTSGNFVPMLSGAVMCDYGQCDYNGRTMDLMDRTIFNRAKHAYGDGISTAWTGGLCEDTMNYMFGNQERNAGTGGRLRGIDRYLFNIMCHLDYSGIRNNFMGPYSNRHRCIEGRPVYDYVLNYTEILLRQQLRGYYAEEATSFLDLAYFVDGRELTQCVLSHLDESLVRFLNTLRKDLRFFADPANVLIIASDHGNQMGPYMHSAAGLVEKTMPTMLLFLHPTMLDRIDERKNRPAGTSRQNLARRLTQLSTPLDTYMTVGDLLGLPLEPTDFYMKRSSTPHSLFDERPESDMNPQCGTTCDWPREVSPSALEFCTPRNS